MASFTQRELILATIARLQTAVYPGTAEAIFKLVESAIAFDIENGFRYAANVPAAIVTFDGETPVDNNPDLIVTNLAVVLLVTGAPDTGVDAGGHGTLTGAKGLMDVKTGVRQAMRYHDGDDDPFQILWNQTSSGIILARKDSPSRLAAVEMRFECKHQDVEL